MIARMMPGRQHADAHRRPREQRAEHRHAAEQRLQRLLHEAWRGSGRTPAGPTCRRRSTARRRAARSRCRAGASASAGDSSVRNSAMPKLTGTAISERDERRHQRAVDHHQAAVVVLHRIPVAVPQERAGRTARSPARRRRRARRGCRPAAPASARRRRARAARTARRPRARRRAAAAPASAVVHARRRIAAVSQPGCLRPSVSAPTPAWRGTVTATRDHFEAIDLPDASLMLAAHGLRTSAFTRRGSGT